MFTFFPPTFRKFSAFAAAVLALVLSSERAVAQAVSYDIVAVKAPRYGDSGFTRWQDVGNPHSIEPGQNLVLVHPNGTEEVIYDCASKTPVCSVVDPAVSFDGTSVYFSIYHDTTQFTTARNMWIHGADVYKINLATRQLKRLTNQEWTPNTGIPWTTSPFGGGSGYQLNFGMLNVGAHPIAGPDNTEWVAFTSTRNTFMVARGFTNPNMQLFIMDGEGKNVRFIGHMNLGSALHPTPLKDGRIMFSSSEAQGTRDMNSWALWSVYPDGRKFEPLMSAFHGGASFHFQTQLSNSDVVVTDYYNLNNAGFGTFLAFTSNPVTSGPTFGSPSASDASNPTVNRGYWYFQPGHPTHQQPRYTKYSFSPIGLRNLTAFSHGEDEASSILPDGQWAGKVAHPSGAPNNDLLLIYSPGPANHLTRPVNIPRVNGGIYLLKGAIPVDNPSALQLIKTDVNFNYQQPRAVVPYSAIYGIPKPAYVPYLPDGDTAFGLVGTASFYNQNVFPGYGKPEYNGLDPFNTSENDASSNWKLQGSVAGKYENSDIHAVRILAMEPSSHLSYGPNFSGNVRGWHNFATERLRILGEIPLRKFDAQGNQPLDGDGNPDTSFLARIPADVPFTFQTLDKNGIALNTSQTWHHVRPGEKRFDCGGCHAHANAPTDWSKTAAGKGQSPTFDLVDQLVLLARNGSSTTTQTFTGAQRKAKMDVEYYRDIRPIFDRSCVGCHSGATPAGKLDLSATPNTWSDNAYACLAMDQGAACGAKPVIHNLQWRQTNASRWVRMFQARRSLLVWKVFGARLDGWLNSDHPTESVPGDASTLPAGANPNLADLDYTGSIMPPPNSGYPALTEDEKMTIARWVDLGAPTNPRTGVLPESNWFTDDLRPTLNISWPRPQKIRSVDKIEFVAYDYYSGLNSGSFKVIADFQVNGAAPGTNLASQLAQTGFGRWSLNVSEVLPEGARGRVEVQVADTFGNITKQETIFTVTSVGVTPLPPNPVPPPGPIPPGNPVPDPKFTVSVPNGPFTAKLRTKNGKRAYEVSLPVTVQNTRIGRRVEFVMKLSTPRGSKLLKPSSKDLKFLLKPREKARRTLVLLVPSRQSSARISVVANRERISKVVQLRFKRIVK